MLLFSHVSACSSDQVHTHRVQLLEGSYSMNVDSDEMKIEHSFWRMLLVMVLIVMLAGHTLQRSDSFLVKNKAGSSVPSLFHVTSQLWLTEAWIQSKWWLEISGAIVSMQYTCYLHFDSCRPGCSHHLESSKSKRNSLFLVVLPTYQINVI